ncbi:hypothetical protein U1Q18_010769 [Sarracenia purpurea var. burkii]
MGRFLYQAGMRVAQGMKEQASKCDSTLKSMMTADSACSGSSSKQTRQLSGALDSTAFKAKSNKLKRADESLRTVMYLSCWGPN